MRTLLYKTTVAIVTLLLPITALANVIGTPILAAGQTLDLDTASQLPPAATSPGTAPASRSSAAPRDWD